MTLLVDQDTSLSDAQFSSLLHHCTEYDDHRVVLYGFDRRIGFRALIAIHNQSRGPAVGGCRIWQYDAVEEALRDVLRLSKGMTHKNACAELAFGGGKAVIMAPEEGIADREATMQAFASMVNALEGDYYTAEDVGTTVDDMSLLSETSNFVFGRESTSGDPSPFTAYGVFLGIEAAVRHRLNRDSLCGAKVAVQGVGNVGYHLCHHLHQAGADIYVSDIDESAILRCMKDYKVTAVPADSIYDLPVDVYAPCGLGGTLTRDTISRLRCSVVAGAANNQLANLAMASMLHERKILYAPDFVINAGGIINIAQELEGYDEMAALLAVKKIGGRLESLFGEAMRTGQSTVILADAMAHQRYKPTRDRTVRVIDLETLS